jgi:hypothetical protein
VRLLVIAMLCGVVPMLAGFHLDRAALALAVVAVTAIAVALLVRRRASTIVSQPRFVVLKGGLW